jgi:hypothetical protein
MSQWVHAAFSTSFSQSNWLRRKMSHLIVSFNSRKIMNEKKLLGRCLLLVDGIKKKLKKTAIWEGNKYTCGRSHHHSLPAHDNKATM